LANLSWIKYHKTLQINRNIKPYDTAVYLAVLSFRNINTKLCNPSIKSIADVANCSERQVNKSLKVLVSAGAIKYARTKTGKGKQVTNKYYFTWLEMDES
jgi:predicted transcriptional regulator